MWNFDLTQAPVGTNRTVEKKFPDGSTRKHEIFEAAQVWAASKCGKVTLSYYIPKEKRWNMFTKDVPPIAWQPFVVPEHPGVQNV